MASEETLLLSEPGDVDDVHEAIRTRRVDGNKRTILMMVSWCGFLESFVAGVLTPSVPRMAADLETTAAMVSLAISVSILALSFGSLCGGAYSTHYGRRFVYLWGLPLFCVGSLGVGLATSVPQLLVSRFIQVSGCAPVLSIGGAVIGDIYKVEERGQAMGIFFSLSSVASMISPTVGGMVAHYASWRFMQLGLGIAGLVTYICMYLYLPETSRSGTRGTLKGNSNPNQSTMRIKFVNPFTSLSLLRSPNILAISITISAVLLTSYALRVPLVYTIAARYGITNEGLIGLCFLPCGIGNVVGALVAGRISDQYIIKWRKKNNGVWHPEDRLRATKWGTLCLVPFSIIGSGLAIKFVDGKIGLIINLICLFMNGVGTVVVTTPAGAYIVDILRERSAEGLAVNTAFRSVLMSFAIAGIFPMIEAIGVTLFDILIGVLSLIGFGIIWFMIRYGKQMRAWVDVGYSTEDSN